MTYCLIDGSILSAPFDPRATLVIPEPRQTAPPPTEILRPQQEPVDKFQSTINDPQPPRTEASPTLTSPVAISSKQDLPEPETTLIADSPKLEPVIAKPEPESNAFLLVMGGLTLLLVMIVVIGFIRQNNASQSSMAATNSANTTRTTNTAANVAVTGTMSNPSMTTNTTTNTTNTNSEPPSIFESMQAEVPKIKEQIRSDPNNADLHRQLGAMLYFTGKYAESESAFRESLRLKPDFAAAHYGLYATLLKLGKTAEAEAERRKGDQLKGTANK